MDKKLKIINFVLILALLSSLTYAATEEEFNKYFQQQISNAPSDDDGFSLSEIQYKIIDFAKRNNFNIYSETKYEFYKKHITITDTDNVLYLSVVRKDMKLTKNEINALSPSQQADVAIVVKKAGGGGLSLIWGGGIGVIILAFVVFLWWKYGNPFAIFFRALKRERMLGRQAKKIIDFEKHSLSYGKREELNMKNMDDIERSKAKLIDDNIGLTKRMENDERRRLALDHEIRSKTNFKDGIYDKKLIKHPNLAEFLNKSGISRIDANEIESIVSGKSRPVMHRLEDNISRIRRKNARIERLINKEIVLDKDMIQEMLKGKEQIDVSRVDLQKVKDFIREAGK
jgi:hypothetical protein